MQILANTHSHNLLLFEHILEAGSGDLEIEKLTEENVCVNGHFYMSIVHHSVASHAIHDSKKNFTASGGESAADIHPTRAVL
jgi:hypothetical protein